MTAEERRTVSLKTAAAMYELGEDVLRAAMDRREFVARRIPGRKPGAPGTSIRVSVAELDKWFNNLPDAREVPDAREEAS